MSEDVIVTNMSLMKGQTLTVTGFPKLGCSRFNLNVGHSDRERALHMDFRFDYNGNRNTIILNSMHKGAWGEEQMHKNFPFTQGVFFKVKIHVASHHFEITLPDGSVIQFPNRLGADMYKYLTFELDVQIQMIKIE